MNKGQILEQTGLIVAVNDVSFSVYDGEIFVVMGLSGSGKSTLSCAFTCSKPFSAVIVDLPVISAGVNGEARLIAVRYAVSLPGNWPAEKKKSALPTDELTSFLRSRAQKLCTGLIGDETSGEHLG